jgi:hypothetical protein
LLAYTVIVIIVLNIKATLPDSLGEEVDDCSCVHGVVHNVEGEGGNRSVKKDVKIVACQLLRALLSH